MKTINILCTLLCTMLLATLPAAAQNTNDDDKNKAIIETNDDSYELNTDDIQLIRFDGGKITVVQPWGDTTFDRTLRTLSFLRPNPGTVRLTVTTSIGTEGSGNRAQEIDGDGKLRSIWKKGDVVYVYKDDDPDNDSPIGTLTPNSEDYNSRTATLSGDIDTEGLNPGQTLYFSTKPRTYDFSSQDGTVESLFYCTADGTITINEANASVSDLNFIRPIAVVKFTLKDKADGTSLINASSLTVDVDSTPYSISPTTPKNELFFGIPGFSNKNVTLTASDGLNSYTYERTGVTFEDGHYYAINVKMTNTTNYLTVPLTFEAKTAGAVVTFTKATTIDDLPIEYSLNGGTWTAYTSGTDITLEKVGDKVSFRGTNTRYATSISMNEYSYFSCLDDCYIYGNIMSLIDKNDFFAKTTLTADHTFSCLFNGNTIYNHATKALLLPATTLTAYCYQCMFMGCTGLTSAPALPAETMQQYCYQNMFVNCKNLTTAPELPATELANKCYDSMFKGCTGLTSAPSLPATTLADYCYQNMFYGCTGLTTAPVLPATELAERCYQSMFQNCTSLNSVTCLATNISATNCTKNWLNGVAVTGTFYKPASMNDWTTGASGIPTGWTVLPVGALKGEFSINTGGGTVHFTQGNLQYQASTSTWRFAEHQYDYVGGADNGNVYVGETKCNNANISGSYSGWIDLFGWGTGNNPTNSSTNNNDYGTFTDWGTNAISNGGNTADLWCTLTKDEWAYLFNNRTNAANLRTFATVNDVVGLILMPDGWTADGVSLTITTANYTSNIISLADWSILESQGCVFLPSAGYRGGTTLDLVQDHGSYWSSMPYESNHAYYVDVKTGGLDPNYQNNRYTGLSVRLVYEKPYFLGSGTEADPYLISSQADWNYLAIKVNSGTNYAGKFFRQTANINVTTMVGEGESKPFSGTYDGDGNTLNLTLDATVRYTAPFLSIVNATIKNVVTTGTVKSTDNHASGLVGFTDGNCTIQNCRVGASVSGPQYLGGIVGHCWHANISIIGCVYTGTLNPASGQKTGGILGWGGDDGGHTITISNCLFAGSLANTSTKFNPIGDLYDQNMYGPNTKNLSNTYYTLAANMSDEDNNSFVKGLSYKGKFARSIIAGTGVTVANAGAATVYDVSGITSYGTGILYDGVLYAGDGEAISLTLSHADIPSHTFSHYTVTGGGTLSAQTEASATLTMTDANQTIGAEWTIITDNGKLPGKFTINAGGGKVYFSQGNLRYTSGAWSFFDNQWDYYTTYSADSWDKFGWSTSATTYGKNTSTTTSDYSGDFVDWGATIGSGWRTLTSAEWTYVFNTRTVNGGTGNGKSYTLGQSVNGQLGIVIYPDNYTGSVYSGSDWASFEAAGCVFLPAAGYRNGTNVGGAGDYGCYWSSTLYSSDNPYHLYFHSNGVSPANNDRGRQCGYLVRLVYEIPYFLGAGTETSPYLISSEADWNYLANKVNNGENYSGKFFRLDADIDVTTMVGNSESNSFRGTFDGNGHTLTISYNTTSDYTAPFRYIQGATFKNLKVTGSITTTMNLAAGIAGLNTGSTATFEQCVTDVTINSSSTTEVGWGRVDYHGGLLARTNNVDVNIIDCVCGGSVNGSNGPSSISYGASFVGVAVSCTVSATRCLSTTSYTNVTIWNPLCHAADAVRSTSVFYYVNGNDVCDGATQVTLSDLNNSSYATALQAGRSTTVWVQYSRTNQPMLKQFAKYIVTYNANGGSGSVPATQAKQHGDDLTLSNSTLTLSGFAHIGWNTNSDGSGTHYDLGDTYSANADVTLYAEWASQTFNYTGAVQTFTVPATGYYTLTCYGAQGGYCSSGLGGLGGKSQLTYPLTQGEVLYIYVGGQGECIDGSSSHPEGGDGGWNGGGKGGKGVPWGGGNGNPYNGGGGGGGATHIATSAIGEITSSTSFNDNHTDLLLIAGGGGGGLSWGPSAGGAGGGDTGGNGHRGNDEWNIAWNNGTLSCGRDGMTSSTGGGSCEGCGGGGAGYKGGNTWTVTYNASNQSYSGAGGSSWGETTNGKDYSTTPGGATAGSNGKAVITWYGTTYPTE